MSAHDLNPQNTAPAPAPVVAGLPAGTETMRTSIFLPPMLQGIDQGPPIPSALNAAPSAFTLMRAFQRRWPLAIGCGLLAAALASLAILTLFPAKFVAFYCAKISSVNGVGLMADRTETADFTIFKSTQSNMAKSRPVVERALNMEMKGRFIKDLGIVRAAADAGDPIEWVQASIKTDFDKAAEIMTVKVSHLDHPEEVTLLANALGKALIDENEASDDARHKAQIEQTEAKQKRLQDEVDRKRKHYLERINGQNANNQGKKDSDFRDELKEARKTLRDKESDIVTARSRQEIAEERMRNPTEPPPASFLDDVLSKEQDAQQYFLAIAEANKAYSQALRNLRDPSADALARYQRAKDDATNALAAHKRGRMPELTRKWHDEVKREAALEYRKATDDLKALDNLKQTLSATVADLEAKVNAFRPPNLAHDLVSLEKDVESLESALKDINKNIQFMKVNVPTPRVSILQDAIEPNAKDTSRQTKLIGAGSIGMFLMTVLGISFFEFRSRKITSSDEVKRGLGLSVIGTVPTLPDKARSPLAQSKLDPYWQNQLMESVDTIRTMLLHSARSNNTRVIMVTSAVGGEGKTSLSTQLAASLARAWKKTLLIDGDLRNPACHKVFDVAQEPGLSEVLRGELSASEAVRSTPLSRLWILPAGHWDSHAVQALAQDNVRTTLEELKQQYDFIILDSCPILPVADSLLLGQNVDGVLMTVMREVSRSPAVHAAQQRIESLGIKVLGAVVIGAKNELGPLGYKYAYQARP